MKPLIKEIGYGEFKVVRGAEMVGPLSLRAAIKEAGDSFIFYPYERT